MNSKALGEEAIRVWPDGTWQRCDEAAYPFMSDDFMVIFVGDADDEACERAANEAQR
jgi:hypothetical protein